MKACTQCGESKPLSEYHHRRDGRRPHRGRFPVGQCKDCERRRVRKNQRNYRAKAASATTDSPQHSSYLHKMVRMGAKEARRYQWGMHLKRVERALAKPDDYEPTVYEPRPCSRCARTFTPTRIDNIYCSTECNWRAQRSRRRAREREAFVEDVELTDVYERDGGLCQLCHTPVDRRCKYPHPRTPVLDHIVPLAKGGTHERKNVQLAHHGCNDKKKARAVGSQLRLLG